MPTIQNSTSQLLWVDCLKGLGIAAVVAGHVFSGLPAQLIFLFHMPLFFFLSGYLFSIQKQHTDYFMRKARHLLIPYAAFLVVLAVPRALKILASDGAMAAVAELARICIGGRYLAGATGVFWFVTCLFLTQQVMNAVLNRWAGAKVWGLVAACLALAYVNAAFPQYWLPLNANVVLAAIPFFYVGYVARSRRLRPHELALTSVLALAGGLLTVKGLDLPFDMKYANYGVPILSLLAALGCIAASILTAQILAPLTLVGVTLRRMGTLSMGIMFLHLPIQYVMLKLMVHSGEGVRFVACLLGSYAISELLDRWQWTRVVFLGSAARPPVDPASGQVAGTAR